MAHVDSEIMNDVICLKNSLLNSNTYVIRLPEKKIVIVDPGDPDITSLKKIIGDQEIANIKVVLTHEHADHCAGLNALYDFKKFELLCTRQTGERISDPKYNLTKYFEMGPLEIKIPFTTIKDGEIIDLFRIPFTFIETPGHSPGSTCILFEAGVFTGDMLMRNTKTPLNMPGSDPDDYKNSIIKLEDYLNDGMRVFPGHGEDFEWKKIGSREKGYIL